MDDEAYTSQKNTLWTEDTVQYLFEETVCGHKVHFWSAETYSALKHSDYEIQIKDIGNFDGYCYRECLPS
jgi:hypothetical protein